MPRLHLKRTPEEEAQHQLRKEARRKSRKRKKNLDEPYAHYDEERSGARSQRYHNDSYAHATLSEAGPSQQHTPTDDEYDLKPKRTRPSTRSDSNAMRDEIEERRFREKMWHALGDDERLDAVEARMNEFGHVPRRWRSNEDASTSASKYMFDDDELLNLDPQQMDDEEYAEWIRTGMYRKTHAEEYAELRRKKAAHAARRVKDKAARAEAARLEKVLEEERCLQKQEQEARRLESARDLYQARWKSLLRDNDDTSAQLTFDDIPWPILSAYRHSPKQSRNNVHAVRHLPVSVDDLTSVAVSAFVLPSDTSSGDAGKRTRKDRLRETFLLFHPDKFEGRLMTRIRECDREAVREGIGQISRVLNELMSRRD